MSDNVINLADFRKHHHDVDFSRGQEPASPFNIERMRRAAKQMEDAIAWLTLAEIPYGRPAANQLKIGTLSYYPTSGTFNHDRRPKEMGRGLTGLKHYLELVLERELPPLP